VVVYEAIEVYEVAAVVRYSHGAPSLSHRIVRNSEYSARDAPAECVWLFSPLRTHARGGRASSRRSLESDGRRYAVLRKKAVVPSQPQIYRVTRWPHELMGFATWCS
jgi:hypothetical protein